MKSESSTYDRLAQFLTGIEDPSCILLREDFDACGPPSEVDAALERLVAEEKLARLRDDAYGLTRISRYTGGLALRGIMEDLAGQYAIRRGAELRLTEAQADYASGRSKQIPNGYWVGVDRPIPGGLNFRKRAVRYVCV